MGKGRIWLWIVGGILSAVIVMILTLCAFNYASGQLAWQEAQDKLRAGGHPLELAEILPPPLPPGPGYFVDHPWIASQAKWREGEEEVIYDDPENQAVLARLREPGQAASLKARSGRPAPEPRRTDFGPIAEELQVLGEGLDPLAAMLAWKKQDDALFTELAAAAKRPAGYFPSSLDVAENPFNARLPYLEYWITTTRTVVLRSRVHLAAGQSETAVREMDIVFRMMDVLEKEPSVLANMGVMTMLAITFNGVWEGLERGAWTETDLVALDREYAARNSVKAFQSALECERLTFCKGMDYLPQVAAKANDPRFQFVWPGMISHLKAHYTSKCLRLSALIESHDWQGVRDLDDETKKVRPKLSHNYALAEIVWAVVGNLAGMAIRSDAHIAIVRTSIALERHYLKHGSFPETLQALDASVTPAPVLDPCRENDSLRYERTPNGRYRLYSIGWNLVDDGGATEMKRVKADSIDYEAGDIVWQFTGATTLPKRS